ncbi:response regulator transcription factor [Mucilaginibacter sp. KACC 22063]|uniref:response regulator transcription factor n=1 Tax=Mucilaginibacter sp. KACC 22063 TaxID=3025666 RepID=UPI00236510D6|nr:response regulator [Mucilaginibacter sp. KACC 22063]WDF55684.1 response regulator [Mucilaginibacter sp. KACC 22063]
MLKRILIADDDPGIVDAVEMMLSFYDYQVSSTYDGNEVTDLVPELNPDLILLDIWMSGVDGRDVCHKLKNNPATSGIPVLMISASKDIAASAIDSGADGFIAKPFDMDDLITKIEDLLHREGEIQQQSA